MPEDSRPMEDLQVGTVREETARTDLEGLETLRGTRIVESWAI